MARAADLRLQMKSFKLRFLKMLKELQTLSIFFHWSQVCGALSGQCRGKEFRAGVDHLRKDSHSLGNPLPLLQVFKWERPSGRWVWPNRASLFGSILNTSKLSSELSSQHCLIITVFLWCEAKKGVSS